MDREKLSPKHIEAGVVEEGGRREGRAELRLGAGGDVDEEIGDARRDRGRRAADSQRARASLSVPVSGS
jgi:hypothetical protein